MKSFTRSYAVLGLLITSFGTACSGRVLDVGAAGGAQPAAAPPAALATGGDTPGGPIPADGVVGVLKDVGIESMAGDATNLYLGTQEGDVLSIPKTGGAPITILDGYHDYGGTEKASLIVDGGFVYMSNLWGTQLARVPTTGGRVEIIADHLAYPHQMAMDATHLYAIVEDSASPTGPAIVRVAKTGGPVELVAKEPAFATSLTLTENDVYFATGYHVGDGSLKRVAKTGGTVQTLATGIDGRSQPGTMRGGAVSRLVVAGERLAFVEPFSGLLAFVPLTGGSVVRATTPGLSQSGLGNGGDGASILGFTYSDTTGAAELVRFDSAGVIQASLKTWTYANPRPMMPGGVDPGVAMFVEPGRVYWVDSDIDNNPTTTIRTAVLPPSAAPPPSAPAGAAGSGSFVK